MYLGIRAEEGCTITVSVNHPFQLKKNVHVSFGRVGKQSPLLYVHLSMLL